MSMAIEWMRGAVDATKHVYRPQIAAPFRVPFRDGRQIIIFTDGEGLIYGDGDELPNAEAPVVTREWWGPEPNAWRRLSRTFLAEWCRRPNACETCGGALLIESPHNCNCEHCTTKETTRCPKCEGRAGGSIDGKPFNRLLLAPLVDRMDSDIVAVAMTGNLGAHRVEIRGERRGGLVMGLRRHDGVIIEMPLVEPI